jgi:monoamine oxidase
VEPARGFDKELLLYVRGQSVLAPNWSESAANQLAETERSLLPPQLLTHYLRQNNPLEDAIAWTKPDYANLDISSEQYLRAQGASTEALRPMNFNPGSLINSVETTSALWLLRNNQRAKNSSKQPMQISGGNSRLPEKMAAALKSLQTNKVVKSIQSSDTGVEVHCSDGSRWQADFAVVTLPFSVLRHVKITPPLGGAKAEAVQEFPYTAVTQIYLTISHSFWESDGYPPQIWTDSVLESVLPIRDATGRVQSLVCFVNGAIADQLDAMSTKALAQFVKSELGRIRPASKGNVEIARVVSWGSDPFARGAFSHFAPRQIRRFRSKMAQPWKRIHFAGEHTAIASPGMESALESAQRVTSEVLARIK